MIARLIKQMAAPLAGRGGAMATGWLVANGVPDNTANAFIAAAAVAVGLGFDVVVAYIAARRTINAE